MHRKFGILLLLWMPWLQGATGSRNYRLPGEFETLGNRGLALNNTGAAGLEGPSVVRVNPALLAINREYSISGAYNWSVDGRDFYQLGVVDGTTAPLAAGLLYTGFQDDYEKGNLIIERDSPVVKRVSLGVAYPFTHFAFGLSGHYVEGIEEKGLEDEVVKGVALGAGALAYLTKSIRIGLSVEHFNNQQIELFAPTTIRAGLEWNVLPELVQVYMDYRQRERIDVLEGPIDGISGVIGLNQNEYEGFEDPERMVFIGSTIKVYNVLRLVGSYGHAISEDRRRSLSGSVGLSHQGFYLSYTLARPYLDQKDLLSSLSLTILLKI